METLSLYSLLAKGGWVMFPIAACSLAGAAIIIERLLWGLRRARVLPPQLAEDVINLITSGKKDQALGLCKRDASSLAKIISVAIENSNSSYQQITEYVEIAGRKENHELQRYVDTLGIIAAVSPLLGLLGTVFGMIKIFSFIGSEGMGSTDRFAGGVLAGGIAEALITTAAGLTIAIPCLVFYRIFIYQARSYTAEMERISLRIVNTLSNLCFNKKEQQIARG